MDRRLELHEILCDILGSRNVYFQPPATIRMQYPAIVYARSDLDSWHADDGVYTLMRKYNITLIASDPDSEVLDALARLPMTRYIRNYASDGLTHDLLETYF